jgi:hypothetical protein
MSDSEGPITPPEDSEATPVRVKRRSGRRSVLLAVVLIGLTIAGVLWALRPRWRTYLGPVNKMSGLRIAVQMPDNWTLDNHMPAIFHDTTLFFREKPSTGISRWIEKNIWHMNDNEGLFEFVLSPRGGMSQQDAATLEQTMRQSQAAMQNSGVQMTLQRVRYPLGPGLGFYVTRRSDSSSGTLHRTHAIALFPDGSPAQRKVVVGLTYQGDVDHFDRDRFVFEEAAQRMRILAP